MPEGWAWCRLKNICTDFIVPQRDKPKSFDGTIPWCRIEDIEGKYLNGSLSGQLVSEETIKAMNMHKCPVGSIICSCSASLGVQAIATVECCTNQTFIGIVPSSDSLFNEYLYYLLKSQTKYFHEIATGTTIKYISRDKFEDLFVALPPIEEQKRIVNRINKNFEQIELLEHNKNDLEYLIRQTKSKILDLAIHGKLVPQDPNDEPSEELLKRIATSDNRPYEKVEEEPFEIPDSWRWVKLTSICNKLVDGDHNPPKGVEEQTEYIMASSRNINYDKLDDLENVRYLSKEVFEIENNRTKAKKGDIFFTSVGTIGRSCIYSGDYNICFQRSVTVLNTNINNQFLKYFFDSNFFQTYVIEHSTGTAQMGFYLKEMANSPIAIPPMH